MKHIIALLCAITAVFLVTACAPAGDTTVVDTGAGAGQDTANDRERTPTQTTINIVEDDNEPVVVTPNTTNTTVIINRPVQPVVTKTNTVTVVEWEEGEEQENEDIAQAFIESSSTYRYDGSDLELVDSEKTNTNPPLLIYEFEYTSTYDGYGDRSGENNPEQETEHRARVVIMNGKVISVIVDDIWNELTSRPVSLEDDSRGRGDPCGTSSDLECSGSLVCVRESDDGDAVGYCTTQA